MKYLIIILFILTGFVTMAQLPTNTFRSRIFTGNTEAQWVILDSPIVNPVLDTFYARYPGTQIVRIQGADTALWIYGGGRRWLRVGGSASGVPTWQQTLIAGSTLTQDNTILIGSNSFSETANLSGAFLNNYVREIKQSNSIARTTLFNNGGTDSITMEFDGSGSGSIDLRQHSTSDINNLENTVSIGRDGGLQLFSTALADHDSTIITNTPSEMRQRAFDQNGSFTHQNELLMTATAIMFSHDSSSTNKGYLNFILKNLPASTNNSDSVLVKNSNGSLAYRASGTGTVTSVALSMPAAFTVSGSPITTSGTFNVSGAGTSSQYIRGDGTLATMDTSAIANFYLKVRRLFSGTSPITYNSTTGVIGINNANTTGTKGAASFTSSFSDNGSGQIDLATLVSAGSCTGCTLNIDAKGRILSYADGPAGATNNTNIGSGFRPVNELTQQMRTYFGGFGIKLDTVANVNGITWRADTTRVTGLPTYFYVDSSVNANIITANNGLTKTLNNIQWGGTLLQHTLVDGGANYESRFTSANPSGSGRYTMTIKNTALFGNALRAEGVDGGIGIDAVSSTGYAANVTSNSGVALQASTGGNTAIIANVNPSSTNTIHEAVAIIRTTTGTPANGEGLSIDLANLTSVQSRVTNQIVSKLTDVTDATYTSQYEIWGANNGTLARKMAIAGNGQMTFDQYTGTNFQTIDTSFNSLVVDGSGNIFKRAGTATLTSFAFTNGNGFTGTVTNPTSTPTLSLTTSLTTGSVPFIGASGALSQNNSNFFWDNSNIRLGIGTNSPTRSLHISLPSDLFGDGTLAKITDSRTSGNLHASGVQFETNENISQVLNGMGQGFSFEPFNSRQGMYLRSLTQNVGVYATVNSGGNERKALSITTDSVGLGWGHTFAGATYGGGFGGFPTLIGARTQGNGVAVGWGAKATNVEAVAVGPQTQATALATVAIGDGALATPDSTTGNEIVIGDAAWAKGNVNFFMGGGAGIHHDFVMCLGCGGSSTTYDLDVSTANHQAFLGWYQHNSSYFSGGSGLFNDFWIGGPVRASAPHDITLNMTSLIGGDKSGIDLRIKGSAPTGAGIGGRIIFETGDAGASDTVLRSTSPKFTINGNGTLKIIPPPQGATTDSIMVWRSADSIIRKIPFSSLGNTIYTGDGRFTSNRTVSGANNNLKFDSIGNFQINADAYIFEKKNATIPYTAAILGSGNVFELGYTPTSTVFSKGAGIIIDTNNNASLGATQIPSTAPLYATGGSTYVSGFQNQGGTFLPVATITTGTTSVALAYYFIQCDASGGNITLNLPAASTAFAGSIGIKYVFYRTDNTGNTVTVNAAGGDSINGTGSFTLVGQYTTKQLQCVSTSAWAQY